jgi:HSP20 family protein
MTSTTGREAFEDLRAAQDEVPRVAGGRGWRAGVKHGGTTAWTPAIDISERADAYVVTVEVPGVTAHEVEITIDDGLLTIQGRRHAAREAAGDKIHRSERGHGVFRRSVTLPSSHVNADRTEASARDGVLEILVPKAPEAQAGLIRIRVSQENAVLTPGHNDEER